MLTKSVRGVAHASVTQGRSNPLVSGVKPDGLGPRLVAGEARYGGGARDLPTVDQIGRGLVLRVAGARAHLVGQAGGAGVERARRSRARGGGRSLDGAGFGAMVHGRTSVLYLRDLQELTNPTEARTGPNGHRSLIGDELVRRRASGINENAAIASARPRG